jgi:hypothetical protein
MRNAPSSRSEDRAILTFLVTQMRKWKKKRSTCEFHDTPMTLLVASFGGACAFITVENTIDDIMESWSHHVNKLLGWQIDMGAICVGTLTFIIFLFILQFLETRSKITAWRSSAPWLPLVGLTAIATPIHIPFYLVATIGGVYCVWAYRRTNGVRQSARLP